MKQHLLEPVHALYYALLQMAFSALPLLTYNCTLRSGSRKHHFRQRPSEIVNRFLCALALLMLASCVPPEKMQRGTDTRPSPALMAEEEVKSVIGMIPANATPIKVAILLPLSGDAAPVGNAMLDAATLALYDEYMSMPADQIHSQIILLPRDTGNSPSTSSAAAQQAVDQGATFIVGPLFGQAVTAMKPMLRVRKVPVISFSNNQAVAEPNIYTYGFLPEQQVLRMAEYAYLNNFQRVALLAPNEAYGQKVRDELSSAYAQKGGMVSPAELYAPSVNNIEAAVARMMAAYNNVSDDRRFQAIFIADGGSNLRTIINALKKNNVDLQKIKLLGASMWDDPEIAKIPELEGAWFPSSPPEPYVKFEKRFFAMYGYKPVRLAGLAYDAVSLIAKLSINSNADHINSALIPKEDGYIGPANGLYRLLPGGISERKLAVMEVTPDGFKVRERAPKNFPPKQP